jgi:CTP-dependent riboflavin kinase
LICARTGLSALEPGTLNVRLPATYRFEPDTEISHAEYGYERLKLKRCRVGGLPAVILRPETHESGNGHGDAYVEVLSAVHLRSALGLADGDALDIVVGGPLSCWPPA